MGRKPKPRRYSDEERAAALAALAANGGNVSATARQLAIPAKTLEHWSKGERKPHAANLGEQKKGPLADAFEDLARKCVGLAAERFADMSPKDLVITAGIAVDKMQLLRGEPTSIDETRDDSRLAAFRDRYARAHAAGTHGADARGEPVHPPPADRATDPVP